jgi:hypothetical protein
MPKGAKLNQVGRHRVVGTIASIHTMQPLTLIREGAMHLATQPFFDAFSFVRIRSRRVLRFS